MPHGYYNTYFGKWVEGEGGVGSIAEIFYKVITILQNTYMYM